MKADPRSLLDSAIAVLPAAALIAVGAYLEWPKWTALLSGMIGAVFAWLLLAEREKLLGALLPAAAVAVLIVAIAVGGVATVDRMRGQGKGAGGTRPIDVGFPHDSKAPKDAVGFPTGEDASRAVPAGERWDWTPGGGMFPSLDNDAGIAPDNLRKFPIP